MHTGLEPRLNLVDYGAISDRIDMNLVEYGEESRILMKLDPEGGHWEFGYGVAW